LTNSQTSIILNVSNEREVIIMTFTIFKASNYKYKETRDFATLEELKAFQIDAGHSLVIDFEESKIWIYDD
jgi:hypothetical protein